MSREDALALAELEQALRRDPGNHEIVKNLGNAHKAAGDLDKAAECYRRSVDLAPGYAPALYNLGLLLHERNQLDEAEALFRRAREAAPGDADVLVHLGVILCKRARFAEGADAFRAALRATPDDPRLWLWLGRACHESGDLRQAAESFGKALELQPDSIDALCGLGCALTLEGRLGEAVDSFRTAVGLQADFADAHHNLAIVLGLLGEHDQALRCSEEALRLKPGDPGIMEILLFEKQHLCDWTGFADLSDMQRRHALERLARPSSPFSLLSIPSTRAEQLASAQNFAQSFLRAAAHRRPAFEFGRRTAGRLRIGYLSADFHEHATAYLMAELFELHDRSRFEILAYSYGIDDGSPMRARLVRAFDRFRDVRGLPDAAAAEAIHADGTDILVDLKGYTQNARTGIVALRPAPVQVNYLGYPGTMGAAFIDYLIADRHVVPPEHAADYSERLALLPGSYQVNDRKRAIAATPSRRDLGLPEQGFVFCCFNQTYKIVPEMFALWMRLLQALPGSVLWLLESNPWVGRNLSREARDRGIDPRRLVFAPKLPLDRHLGRLRAADLFLDTLPCNAHTTASDALWAGLPLITLSGDTFASRVAGSLLNAVGMQELVAGSMRGYEDLALGLAREPARLEELRNRLARSRDSAPLFDTPSYVRNLEAAYERMWQHFRAGEGPRAFKL